MLHDDDLRQALREAGLGHLPLTAHGGVPVLQGVPHEALLDVWRTVRALVPTTGRWPVAVLPDASWYLVADGAPEQAARLADAVPSHGDALSDWVDDLPWDADLLVRYLERRFPAALGLGRRLVEEVGAPTTEPVRVDWLYRELLADPALRAQVEVRHLQGTQQWHRPSELVALALLPGAHGWLAPAVLCFHSWQEPDRAVALAAALRRWEDRYGAELVAHWGTVLQLVVARPPSDPDVAYALAAELKDVGGSLQHHRYELALALPGSDAWMLHDRP